MIDRPAAQPCRGRNSAEPRRVQSPPTQVRRMAPRRQASRKSSGCSGELRWRRSKHWQAPPGRRYGLPRSARARRRASARAPVPPARSVRPPRAAAEDTDRGDDALRRFEGVGEFSVDLLALRIGEGDIDGERAWMEARETANDAGQRLARRRMPFDLDERPVVDRNDHHARRRRTRASEKKTPVQREGSSLSSADAFPSACQSPIQPPNDEAGRDKGDRQERRQICRPAGRHLTRRNEQASARTLRLPPSLLAIDLSASVTSTPCPAVRTTTRSGDGWSPRPRRRALGSTCAAGLTSIAHFVPRTAAIASGVRI